MRYLVLDEGLVLVRNFNTAEEAIKYIQETCLYRATICKRIAVARRSTAIEFKMF